MGQRKALVAWGGWEGHTPQESTEITKTMLESNHFVVDVVEGTEAFRDPDLSRYDLIVPVITMSTIEKEEVEKLCKTVEKGTGLAGFHGCMCDSFRNSVEYQFMTGFLESAESGSTVEMTTSCERPEAMKTGLPFGHLD